MFWLISAPDVKEATSSLAVFWPDLGKGVGEPDRTPICGPKICRNIFAI